MLDFTAFVILFFKRKPKKNPEEFSIYARITVNGKCSELSLKRKTLVNEWDASKGRLKGTTSRVRSLASLSNNKITPSFFKVYNQKTNKESFFAF